MAALLASVDELSVTWGLGCCVLSGAFYTVLPSSATKDFSQRFEWAVRCTEGLQAVYISAAAVRHLLYSSGPLPTFYLQTMAGYLLFDSLYELVLPFVRGTGHLDPAFLAHHLLGLAAHGLAKSHSVLRTVTPFVYLAEISTPFLHVSWMLKTMDRGDSKLFLANGIVGAVSYLLFRILLPPYTLYSFRNPDAWTREPGGKSVHAAFLCCQVAFIGLNLMWFKKLVKMATKATSRKKE